MSNLLSELKRRNVIRMAGLYLVGAWLITQVSATVLPLFSAPIWMPRGIVIALIIGFIPAMIFAWIFEFTPDGLKRDSDIPAEQSIAPQTAQKLNRLIVALLVLAVVYFTFDKFVLAPKREAALVTETTQTVKAAVRVDELALGVAVLPFENLSADPDNAFFTSGVYEDVLTYLSRIDQIRVISRTSMEKIAKQGMEISQIGKHLGVSHVLEGSVRRSGDQVRVTVQLIKTSNDEHVWAENYDRKLEDIFSIQTEIAKTIAQQLKTELSPTQKRLIENIPTSNLKAYDLFMKARELDRFLNTTENYEQQIRLLEQAMQLDPNFVDAELKLAASYGRMAWMGADPNGVYRAKAEALKNKLVKEHPNTYQAYAAKGYFEYTINKNYQAALEYFQKALLERPNDLEILSYIASSYKRLLQFEQGIEVNKKLLLLDPENASNALELLVQLTMANRIDEALAQAKSTLNKFPNDSYAQTELAELHFFHLGNVKEYLLIREQYSPVEKLIQTSGLYRRLTTNKSNLEERIAILEKSRKPSDFFNNLDVDLGVADLLSLHGFENRSQQRAKSVLAELQKDTKKVLSEYGNDTKEMNAMLSYAACLANDNSAFALYSKAYLSAPELELLGRSGPIILHARALAECGQIKQAFDQLNQQATSAHANITHWGLILDPRFQHYFSELPEYQALQKRLQQQKQAKNVGRP